VETFSRETLDPWFVTGFVDGEGSFTFSRSGKQIALYFAIKLAATERAFLEAIQAFFGGVGRIYDVAARTKAVVMFRVTRIDDLVQVVTHFDSYPLQSEKRRVYEVWRRMVDLKREFRKADHDALDELAVELSSRVPRNQS
jgi:hypothetical protein